MAQRITCLNTTLYAAFNSPDTVSTDEVSLATLVAVRRVGNRTACIQTHV